MNNCGGSNSSHMTALTPVKRMLQLSSDDEDDNGLRVQESSTKMVKKEKP